MTNSIVVTSGLTKRYGEHAAVDDVGMRVAAGEIYGFLGPNGAGKTTTLRMLVGLIRPSAGAATVLGGAPGDPSVQRRIGALIEGPGFYPYLSGRDNLRVLATYRRLGRTEVADALDRVGLADRADDKFRTYSLGMKQRLGVGAALLGRPDLLILDEPTNGLDPAGMAEMRELITELAADGHTILLSSHLLTEVQETCDRVGVISGGRLIAESTVAELRGAASLLLRAEPVGVAIAAVRAALGTEVGLRITEVPPPRGAGVALRGGEPALHQTAMTGGGEGPLGNVEVAARGGEAALRGAEVALGRTGMPLGAGESASGSAEVALRGAEVTRAGESALRGAEVVLGDAGMTLAAGESVLHVAALAGGVEGALGSGDVAARGGIAASRGAEVALGCTGMPLGAGESASGSAEVPLGGAALMPRAESGLASAEVTRGGESALSGTELPPRGAELPLRGSGVALGGGVSALRGTEVAVDGGVPTLRGSELPLRSAEFSERGAEFLDRGGELARRGRVGIRIEVDANAAPVVARAVVEAGAELLELRVDEKSLEEVFFEITEGAMR